MAFVGNIISGAVDIVEDVIGAVGDAVEWVVDEVVAPVVDGVGNVIESALSNPLETIATVAAVVTGQTWVIPIINGASTLANGGNIGDALESAAVSYLGGKVGAVAGTYTGATIADAWKAQLQLLSMGKTSVTLLLQGALMLLWALLLERLPMR